MPSLLLALLRCMVHRDQDLVHPSPITIMILTTLCVFNELTLIILINPFSSFFLNEVLLIFIDIQDLQSYWP
jgi:hypothetical protein